MIKILLIEDNIDVRENTAEILELASYEVHTAKDGKEGVALALSIIPDLIICDIMMPILDGYGVLHLLLKNEATANIPFIFLTAMAERSDLRKGMDAGADDYITKPFDSTELLNAIEGRLKRANSLKKDFPKNMDGLNAFIASAKNFDDLKKISEEHELRFYKKKDCIYREDAYPRGLFFLVNGKVKTYRTNDQGKEFITGLYKEGDFFGYNALLEEGKYKDTATSIDDAEVCLIPKEDFLSLIYKNAEVSKKFIKMISENLQEKEEQLVKLAYNSVRKRVAEALATLHNRYNTGNETTFSISIGREDLANLAGTATETTIRTLSDFKEEGIVDMKGSVITIKSLDKLVKMRN